MFVFCQYHKNLYPYLYTLIFCTHIINKLLHGWFVWTIFVIHSLWRIAKLTGLTILHNSWIKIVRTHQPWSNLYLLNGLKTIHFIPILSICLSKNFQCRCCIQRENWSKSFVIIHMCFIRYKTTATVVISFVFCSWIINEFLNFCMLS